MGAGVARHRPYETEYMAVREDNLAEVAEWCGGELDEEAGTVLVPTVHGQETAGPGQFVIGGKLDFYRVGAEVFAIGFETVRAAS